MIHRTYIAQLPPLGYSRDGEQTKLAALRSAQKSGPKLGLQAQQQAPGPFPPGLYLDIIVSLPGSRARPVTDAAVWPPGTLLTQAPQDWCTMCDPGWYYEIRSRALRLEYLVGANGFVPRTNLGYHLSICQLQDPEFNVFNGNLLPTLALSSTLALPPVADPTLDDDYDDAFPDPSYGPVIRLWHVFSAQETFGNPLYLVNFMLQENKDEDFTTLGAI